MRLRLILVATLLSLPAFAAAGPPSAEEIRTAVELRFQDSARQQIAYLRKTGSEDSLRLAREMGTLADPDDIRVSDLKVHQVAPNGSGGYDAATDFDLHMGATSDRLAAKVRLERDGDGWRVTGLQAQ